MPVLIVLVLLPMQFALWWHGKQAAELAAEEGLDAAQAFGADVVEDGRRGAYGVVSQAGNLTEVSVEVASTATTVTVEVRGSLDYSVIGTFTVTARASGPIERFIPVNER
jgi:hypothetical protein